MRGPMNPSSENTGASTFPAPCPVLAHSHLNNPDGDTDGSYPPDSLIYQARGTRANGEVVPADF